jgi:hypothetical protein
MNAISLSLNKEMAKESQLKGLMPLRNPQNLLLWHIHHSLKHFRQSEWDGPHELAAVPADQRTSIPI